MTTVTCPQCSHPFNVQQTADGDKDIDTTVVRWFRSGPHFVVEVSTAEAYENYVRADGGIPASRARFVRTLAHLGVEQVIDGDTEMLITA